MKRGLEKAATAWTSSTICRLGLLFALVCFYSFLFPAVSLSQEDPWSVSGLIQLRYEGRYLTDDEGEDHKLFQMADLTISETKWNHFRFTFSGDLYQDLDGKDDVKEVDATRTVRDTWHKDVDGFVYVAQAELYDLGAFQYARLGRQYIKHELSTTHLDGVDCLLGIGGLENRVKPFFYGGIPVRLYDDESDEWDSHEVGGGLDLFLGRWTRFTYEHRYTKEDIEDDPDIYGSYRNPARSTYQQSALAVRHNLLGQGYGYGSLYLLNNKPRWVNAVFSTLMDRIDLDADLTYLYQFEKIEDMPTNGPLYTGLVGPIKPYHDFTLDLMKGIYEEDVWISAGTQWRVLDSGEEESEFNHSYHREYLGVIFEDLFKPGLRFSLQADYWAVFDDDNDDSTLTVVGSVGYERPDAYSLSLGSSYSLFKYDYFLDENEKEDVYTVSADGRYYLGPKWYVEGRYQVDIYAISEHRFVATIGLEL